MKVLSFIVMSIVCHILGNLLGYNGVYVGLLLLILIEIYDNK